MSDFNLAHWALLACAALGAGVLNAVAGGGSFLTFPALVLTGIPPIAANATSALAVSPGYLGSSWGFKAELAALPRRVLLQEAIVAALGGLVGAALLLLTPAKVFAGLVPWLLLFATALFAFGPSLLKRLGLGSRSQDKHSIYRLLGLAFVAIYGGYFNGGLGILLMALYALSGESRIHTANALKNANSLVLSLLSVAAFAWAGAIVWTQGVWMMAWATLGGFLGARIARRLSAAVVRTLVIATGLLMFVWFLPRPQ
ncbi:MAG: hypothetical protein RLZZ612_1830 [Pseudomonadota bacterium]|jgi:uncharacterized membrane protein YfcA